MDASRRHKCPGSDTKDSHTPSNSNHQGMSMCADQERMEKVATACLWPWCDAKQRAAQLIREGDHVHIW